MKQNISWKECEMKNVSWKECKQEVLLTVTA